MKNLLFIFFALILYNSVNAQCTICQDTITNEIGCVSDTSSSTICDIFGSDFVLDTTSSNSCSSVSDCDGARLPVELSYFKATFLENSVLISWTTETEINNHYFQVQRSYKPDIGFENIGYVSGSGTTNEAKEYEFIDYSPPTGTVYFRLKQVDFDGNYEYSPVSVVDVSSSNYNIVFINPISSVEFERAIEQIKNNNKDVTVKVFDYLGSEIKPNEAKSMIVVCLTSKGKTVSQKVLIRG